MQKKILSFCCGLLNSACMLYVLFPYIEDYGFQGPSEKLLPFVKTFANSTNSLFLFISGCVIIFGSGVLYYYFVIRTFSDKRGFMECEAFISLVCFAILFFGLSPQFGVVILALHLFASAISYSMLSDLLDNIGPKLNAWVVRSFYALFSIILLYFLFDGPLSFIFNESYSVTLILAPLLFT